MDEIEQPAVSARSTPMHLWVIGVLSLLWNCIGGYDYTMTHLRDPAYLTNFPAEVMTYIDAAPALFTAAWAFGVWGALAGSVALLLRSRLAVPLFALSLLGLAGTALYEHVLTPAPVYMLSGIMLGVMLLIWLIAIALLIYARAMARLGVLR